MPAPSSSVDICNLALDWLGQTPDIMNINVPENDNETIFSRHYDSVRQGLLRSYAFSFAQTEVVLAPVNFPNSGPPPNQTSEDYLNRFLLPTDCLRLLRLGSSFFRIRDYILEGRYILCSPKWRQPILSTLSIRYVWDNTDVTTFDSLFVDFLALALAKRLTFKYQRSNDDVKRIAEEYASAMGKCVGTSGQESKPKRIDISHAQQARFIRPEFMHNPSNTFWMDVP